VDADFQDLVQWLELGYAIAVSDGSYKENMGTSSWRILSKHDETKIIAGANFVQGEVRDETHEKRRDCLARPYVTASRLVPGA
jgi:hypothetical protein